MKLYEDEYCCRLIRFPGSIHAAVMLTQDGSDFPNIYINDQLSPQAQQEAFLHELRHLERDDFHNELTINEIEEGSA